MVYRCIYYFRKDSNGIFPDIFLEHLLVLMRNWLATFIYLEKEISVRYTSICSRLLIYEKILSFYSKYEYSCTMMSARKMTVHLHSYAHHDSIFICHNRYVNLSYVLLESLLATTTFLVSKWIYEVPDQSIQSQHEIVRFKIKKWTKNTRVPNMRVHFQ